MKSAAQYLRSPLARHVPHAVLTVVVEIGLRVRRLPPLAESLGVPLALHEPGAAAPEPPPGSVRFSRAELARYRAAVRVMGRWPFGGDTRCLRTALVAGRQIRHRSPVLELGVRRVDGTVQAHAWLSVEGRKLDPAAADYTAFTSREAVS